MFQVMQLHLKPRDIVSRILNNSDVIIYDIYYHKNNLRSYFNNLFWALVTSHEWRVAFHDSSLLT